jgi:tetratricopeptide (TPR) repeat protein
LLEISDDARSLLRARLLIGQGDLLVHRTELQRAEAILRQAVSVSRELGDAATLGFALFHLSQALFWQAKYGASRPLAEEGAACAAAAGLRIQEHLCLQVLAGIAQREVDYTTAKRHAERALALATAAGYPRGIAMEYLQLGQISLCLGELSAARSFLERGLASARQDPWPHGPAFFLTSLGAVATAQGDVVRARECLRESLVSARERRVVHPLTEALEGCAKLATVEHRPRVALRLAAAAAVERERHAAPQPPVHAAMHEPYLARARRAAFWSVAWPAHGWIPGRTVPPSF